MGHLARLQLVGKVTYYLGWLSLVGAALVHLGVGRAALASMSLTKRNLLETAVVFFVICIASEIRATTPAEIEARSVVKRGAAA